MKHSLLLALTVFMCFAGNAQDTGASNTHEVKYISWIHYNSKLRPLKGTILEVNDSTLLVIDASSFSGKTVAANYTVQSISVSSINKIKVRKMNSVGRGYVIGTMGGALAGAIIGLASGDDECPPACIVSFSAEAKAGLGAVIGSVPGALVGLLIGRKKKSILIKGDQQLYAQSIEELKSYSLKQQQVISSSQQNSQ